LGLDSGMSGCCVVLALSNLGYAGAFIVAYIMQ
jgi:hypothetical protein